MATNLIVTVSKSSIHSLAHQGILVHESFHQIRDLVRARLGDAYALLFAEPSPSKDGSSIDWYTPVQGTAKRLTDLPEEEQRAARAATVRMAQDIARVAVELKQSGIAPQVTRGTILELALQYPDENCIYVIGEQPVFTCWGFGPGTPGAQPQDLTRLGQVTAPPKAPPAQPIAAQKRRGGISWLWLLPLLLLPLLFFLLTASFGGNAPLIPIPGFNFTCPALPFPKIPDFNFKFPALPFAKKTPISLADGEKDPLAEAEKLRAEIQTLEKKLLALAEHCPPEQESNVLVIPKNPADMSFLRGRWSTSNIIDKSQLVFFDFDSSGQGTVTVRKKGYADCASSVVASMNAQGVLIIEEKGFMCPDGRIFLAETVECRGDVNNRSVCHVVGAEWLGTTPMYKIDGHLAAAGPQEAEGEKASSPEAEKLRAEIQALEKKLLILAEQCPPETAPPGREAKPEQERQALVIPEKPSDMNFLRGRWLCDRGLQNRADGQPIIVLYDFDSNGKGTATVRQKGREDCVGPAHASINAQGVLVIQAERQVCPNGRGYAAETVECRADVDNRRAMCLGKSADGADWGEESVPFYKTENEPR